MYIYIYIAFSSVYTNAYMNVYMYVYNYSQCNAFLLLYVEFNCSHWSTAWDINLSIANMVYVSLCPVGSQYVWLYVCMRSYLYTPA